MMNRKQMRHYWFPGASALAGLALLFHLLHLGTPSGAALRAGEQDLLFYDGTVECTVFPGRDLRATGIPASGPYGRSQNYSTLSVETEMIVQELFPPGSGTTETPVGPWVSRIDHHIFSTLQQKNIPTANIAGDEAFLRRVTLDLTGRIPTPERVMSFLADTDTRKRAIEIDRLLDSPEWVDRWTMWTGDLLKNNARSSQIRRYDQGRNAFYSFIRASLAENKPYNQFVSELITAQGDSFENGPANFIVGGRMSMGPAQDTYDRQLVQTATMFLGMRHFDCLLCHDGAGHLDLVNLWGSQVTRSEAWQMAAFFSRARIRRPIREPNTSYLVSEARNGTYALNTDSGNRPTRQPADDGEPAVLPQYIFSGRQGSPEDSFRQVLAEELTRDPQFARATVNYLWKELFGLGIVEPADAFDLARLDPLQPPAEPWTIQPTHPELLEELSFRFIDMNYDLKALMREITNSQAYQLSSQYDGEWEESYTPYFARHIVRRMTAEQLYDALTQSSGVAPPLRVRGFPEQVVWAMQLPETTGPRGPVGPFLDDFLRGDRDEVERKGSLSMTQALALMNDAVVMEKVRNGPGEAGRFGPLLASGMGDNELLDYLYLSTLSRFPASDERAAGLQRLQTGNRVAAVQDMLWALYNKVDFLFNY